MPQAKAFRYFKISIWSIIFLLSIYISYLWYNYYLGDQLKTQIYTIVSNAISDFTIDLTKSNCTVMAYTSTTDPLKRYGVDNYGFTLHEYYSSVADSLSIQDELSLVDSENASHISDYNTSPDITSIDEEQRLIDTYYEEDEYSEESENLTIDASNMSKNALATLEANEKKLNTLKKNLSLDYLLDNFYYVSSNTGISKSIFNVKKLISKDLTIEKNSDEPQILIYHTHAHEYFSDSDRNNTDDLMLGVGEYLAEILTKEYGYNVLHHTGIYDQGVYKKSYTRALSGIEQILKENPSIKVVFDMHRDGVSENNKKKTTVTIGGKKMAMIMFFNGVSQNKDGPISYLKNPNLQTNLAFSLQMKMNAMKTYPELTKKIFLRKYRYNMHLAGKYSLIEVGDNNNTVEEAKNAMIPLAHIIDMTLQGE